MQIKERPILYSAPMVNAILDDRKTQTRRVIKPSSKNADNFELAFCHETGKFKGAYNTFNDSRQDSQGNEHPLSCPYGQPGDRQWVRENTYADHETSDCVTLAKYSDGQPVIHDYDPEQDPDGDYRNCIAHWWYSREVCPSIHMPRWASRIDTLIKDIRIERLQDISEQDALAEGLFKIPDIIDFSYTYDQEDKCGWQTARAAFKNLWDKINAKTHPWQSNPWVWVIDFERIKP